MKKMKRFLAMMIACVMVILAVPTVTNAATKTLTSGQTVTTVSYDDYYKVTVPKEGYITVYVASGKNAYGNYHYGNARVYMADKKTIVYGNNDKTIVSYENDGAIVSLKYGVSAGTYYIKADANTKLKYVFTAAAAPTNYCKAKATELKVNTYASNIRQTPDYTFDRWYKITLTKEQAITFTSPIKLYSSSIKVYSPAGILKVGSSSDWQSSSGTTVKTKVLPKSTYYICVKESAGSFFTFKWK